MESYNVYIDSNSASVSTFGSSTRQYTVNWASIMPEGSYNVSFSFVSQSDDIYLGAEIASVFCNLGGNNQFKAGAFTSSAIGFLSITSIGTSNCYLYSELTTNPKVYLQQRPNDNELIIQICDGLDTSTEIPVTHYCMILHFERIS